MNKFATPAFENKIVPIVSVAENIKKLPRPIVLTNGVFDILHRGHVTYLAQARSLGASLIVAINSDKSVKRLGKGTDRPINSEADRASILAALESTSLITIFDETVPLEVVKLVRPDIYVKGGDYEHKPLPEAEIVESYGGRVEKICFDHEVSTTQILQKIRKASFTK